MDMYIVVSGAGKTYTMLGTDSEPGVMVRALTQIFDGVLQTSEEYAYQVSLSYLEVNCYTRPNLFYPINLFKVTRDTQAEFN